MEIKIDGNVYKFKVAKIKYVESMNKLTTTMLLT